MGKDYVMGIWVRCSWTLRLANRFCYNRAAQFQWMLLVALCKEGHPWFT